MGVCACKCQKKNVTSTSKDVSFMLPCGPPPLDKRQIFRLKQSWKRIRRDMKETGVEMFARLFRNNADLRLYITKFSDIIEEDDVRISEIVLKTAFREMQNIDDYIVHIDNIDHVSKLITRMRLFHMKVEGYSHSFFWKMKDPFLDAVKITLGDRYTDSMEAIYVITIDYFLRSVSGGKQEDDKSLCQEEIESQIEIYEKYLGESFPLHYKYHEMI